MSDFEAFDLDRATGRAWSQFQARLGVHLAEMGDDDALVVSVESADEDETGPYVQFLATDAGIHMEASSNQYLTGPHRLSARAEVELADLGLAPPTCAPGEEPAEGGSANHFVLAERSDADRLAVTAVRVLRRVFDVPHPAFLEADDLFGDDPTSATEHLDQAMQAVVPRDRDHLLELVDEALAPVFGHVPEKDDDGDIPVVSGSSLVFVRVHERTPTIELLASVVSDIEDLARARFEVGVLNRDSHFVRYALVDDSVLAYLHIPGYPFVPHHLRALLQLMASVVDGVDDDLAVRIGGRRFSDSDASLRDVDDDSDGGLDELDQDDLDFQSGPPPMHPAVLTILQLEAEEPGSVSPELAASICEHDRDLILALISDSSAGELAWREQRDLALLDGDEHGAEIAGIEMAAAERTGSLLRRALRVVAEAELAERHRPSSGKPRYRRRPRSEDPPSLFDDDPSS